MCLGKHYCFIYVIIITYIIPIGIYKYDIYNINNIF